MLWRKKTAGPAEAPQQPLKRCSFCNKSQRDVAKLIAGPRVCICSECVDICNDVLEEDRSPDPGHPPEVSEAEREAVERGESIRCALCGLLIQLESMIQVPERGWICLTCVEAIGAARPGPRPTS